MREPRFEIKRPVTPTPDDMHRALCEQGGIEAIDPNQFRDLRGNANVRADLRYAEDMENRFKAEQNIERDETRKLSEIFEIIFCEQAELSDWLGPDTFTSRTSRYDDIANGVDVVAEFQEAKASVSHPMLAIDVTVGWGLDKKLRGIRDKIATGELAYVKYFVSERTNEKEELFKIPKVVIGAEAGTVKELGELRLAGDKKALAEHPFQFVILEEIALQLEVFKKYAEKCKRGDIAKIYEHMSEIIQNIRIKKLSSVENFGWRDKTFETLKRKLKDLENL